MTDPVRADNMDIALMVRVPLFGVPFSARAAANKCYSVHFQWGLGTYILHIHPGIYS